MSLQYYGERDGIPPPPPFIPDTYPFVIKVTAVCSIILYAVADYGIRSLRRRAFSSK